MNRITCDCSVLASPLVVRPRCSGSSSSTPAHVRSTSRRSQAQAVLLVLLVALVASPVTVSAAPPTFRSGIDGFQKRQSSSSQSSSNSTQSNGSISMNIWLPVLLLAIMFGVFSFIACLRRRVAGSAATATTAASNPSGNTTRPRQRPRRTPSQVSTKSLPPYMKEPGDHELVLFRGPSETEDDEHPEEVHDTTFDITLDRIESVDTMADSSSANLLESVARPPELHRVAMPHDHRRSAYTDSLGSVGSEVEFLPAHQRGISADSHADLRGEAPSYTEAVTATTTISLNDPQPNNVSSNAVVPPSSVAGGGHSRFSFLKHNPFSSHNGSSNQSQTSTRSQSPALHGRGEPALSRFSSRESHESRHSRSPSGNNLSHSHSASNSNLFRAFRSHSPGMNAGSSTISLDSISAPLTHTLIHAEFHAPKGGLLTPEQVKLITSREALEKFGMPYGPDAVAAFSLSRERPTSTVPPPDFESVVGEHQERPDTGTDGVTMEAVAQRSNPPDPGLETVMPRPTSISPTNTSITSYATVPEPDANDQDSQVQTVQGYASDGPRTARPMTPRTARPSGNHRSIARHP